MPRKKKTEDTKTGLDANDIAEACPDAIILLEAAVAVANTDRYRRNSALMALVRGYMVSQEAIKELQDRLDYRAKVRADRKSAEEVDEEAE